MPRKRPSRCSLLAPLMLVTVVLADGTAAQEPPHATGLLIRHATVLPMTG